MRALVKEVWATLQETGGDWVEDNVSRVSAALAYHRLPSLASLLIIPLAAFGIVFGHEAAAGQQVVAERGSVVGRDAAAGIPSVVIGAR